MIWSHCEFQGVPPSSTLLQVDRGWRGWLDDPRKRSCGYYRAKYETHDEPRYLQHRDIHGQPPPRIDPALVQHTGLSRCDGQKASPWRPPCLARAQGLIPPCGPSSLLSRGAWLFASCCRGFSRFGYSFNRGRQFQLGLFRSAMVASVKMLDAGSFFFIRS
jgi:hypothetical protein